MCVVRARLSITTPRDAGGGHQRRQPTRVPCYMSTLDNYPALSFTLPRVRREAHTHGLDSRRDGYCDQAFPTKGDIDHAARFSRARTHRRSSARTHTRPRGLPASITILPRDSNRTGQRGVTVAVRDATLSCSGAWYGVGAARKHAVFLIASPHHPAAAAPHPAWRPPYAPPPASRTAVLERETVSGTAKR